MQKPAISVQKRRAVYKKWKLQRSLVNFFRSKDLWSPRKAKSKPRYGNWQLTLPQGEPQSHINLMSKIGKPWPFTSMPTSWGRDGANHPQRQSLNLSISLTFSRDIAVTLRCPWNGMDAQKPWITSFDHIPYHWLYRISHDIFQFFLLKFTWFDGVPLIVSGK